MICYVSKAMFRNRWYVYEMGKQTSYRRWLATFRTEGDAWRFIAAKGQY